MAVKFLSGRQLLHQAIFTRSALFSIAFLGETAARSAGGGVPIAQAYRLCEAALVAPIEYISLPMAIF